MYRKGLGAATITPTIVPYSPVALSPSAFVGTVVPDASTCGPSGAFLKDPSGKIILSALWWPGLLFGGGVIALMTKHPILAVGLGVLGFFNLPVFSCTAVPAGNTCTGFTTCETFLCRNGGCGF